MPKLLMEYDKNEVGKLMADIRDKFPGHLEIRMHMLAVDPNDRFDVRVTENGETVPAWVVFGPDPVTILKQFTKLAHRYSVVQCYDEV